MLEVLQNYIYKVAENNSAIPQDRFEFKLDYLVQVYNDQLSASARRDSADIFEYGFFAEKTIASDRLSVDVMVPFFQSSLIDPARADLVASGFGTETSFGDIAFGGKWMFVRTERGAMSAGLRVEAPTNEEFVLREDPTLGTVRLEDDVWHLTPFVAFSRTPTDRLFLQSFLSYRMGSGSIDRTRTIGTPVTTLREQDYFMADLSAGYWLIPRSCQHWLTGLASILELHYTGTFDHESKTFSDEMFGNNDVLNLTAGITALINDRVTLSTAVAVPLRDTPFASDAGLPYSATDRHYDWALMANVNVYFGR